jgi:hypothetical protein
MPNHYLFTFFPSIATAFKVLSCTGPPARPSVCCDHEPRLISSFQVPFIIMVVERRLLRNLSRRVWGEIRPAKGDIRYGLLSLQISRRLNRANVLVPGARLSAQVSAWQERRAQARRSEKTASAHAASGAISVHHRDHISSRPDQILEQSQAMSTARVPKLIAFDLEYVEKDHCMHKTG